jgi:hypothetical protein
MIILFILVSLSLVLSLISVLILAENHIGIGFKGTEGTPIPTAIGLTNTPFPSGGLSSPTPFGSNISIIYAESSREEVSNDYRVTLNVNTTYINGNEITIDYSQFYLRLYAQRFIAQIPAGTAYPLNNGTFTIGASHETQTFQLTFEFPVNSFNGMDNTGTQYNLEYNGTATAHFANQT